MTVTLALGSGEMGFLELIGATAIGATVPVVLSRYLDHRSKRREAEALSKTGAGRLVAHFMTELDKSADRLQQDD